MIRSASPPAAIFWSHVDVDRPMSEIIGTKCWVWDASINGDGYGQFGVCAAYGGWRTLAHRFSYENRYGPIAKGITVDHLCRNTLFVKPSD